jgi:glycerol kinase
MSNKIQKIEKLYLCYRSFLPSIMTQFECVTEVFDDVLVEAGGSSCSLIGSIDQGTSSTRFLVFTKNGRIAASSQMEHTQIFPHGHVGWHEHNPIELWENTLTCMKSVVCALKESKFAIDLKKDPLKAIGITNQRETTIAWNLETGQPYYNAIVWDDLRTVSVAEKIGEKDSLREKTGLPLASYFAGTKVRWLIDNVSELRKDLMDEVKHKQVRFGTVDSWLVYQLTGTQSSFKGAANVGGDVMTDVSNASRWLFLNLHTMKWDQDLIDTVCHGSGICVAAYCLPEIKSSSGIFGHCATDFGVPELEGVCIAGILGDQQAALFGQCAFHPGEAKNTYGTGLFLMMNTGTKPVPSTNGLLTTVAYEVNGETMFALEGSVSHSGSTIQWLRDQLGIIRNASESETLASEVDSNEGLYFVPAFSGLFAPYWRSDARACILGMTASHTKHHICRGALEATAYQTNDVFEAIENDSNVFLKELRVDGGGTANRLLMQFQADITNVPVVKPVVKETTALGAAFAAGLAVGIFKDLDEIRNLWQEEERFEPIMSEHERERAKLGWKKAISKSMGWECEE